MSARTSRRASHTPTVSTPSRPERPPSPLSPTRATRTEEKKTMQNLNDRFSAYIEAVRSREAEIQSLRQERSIIEETHSTEITQTKTMFNKEINNLRRALDQTSKDKAKIEMLHEKSSREATEAKSEASTYKRDLDKLEKSLANLEKTHKTTVDRMNTAEAEVSSLKPEVGRLQKKLDNAKLSLEDETLKRVDLQNQILSKDEQLKFMNQMHEQQLNGTRVRKQLEISEIDGRLSEDYERRYEDKLKELRETYESQSAESQAVFAREYDDKIRKLQEKLDVEKQNAAGLLQEMRELETKVSGLTSRNLELESLNTSLQKRMADMVRDMDNKSGQFRADMARKDAEVRSKEEQMYAMEKDYRELMEVKVALDTEIALYRKLLEGEEDRLGMSPTSSPHQSSSSSSHYTPAPGRGIKRKRTLMEEEEEIHMATSHEGKGNLVIEPVTKESRCIRLCNKTVEDVNIGGWTLSNDADGNETTYKFHRATVLKPGDICSVWSSDSNEAHAPPLNLVMKKGGWVIGKDNVATLRSKDGEEEAVRKSWQEKRQSSFFLSGTSQQQPDSKSCAIM